MKIKRVVQGTALAALAAAAWMGAGSDASAAAFDTENITVKSDAIEVDFDTPELMVSVLKVGKGKTETKITSWDVYEGGSAMIELSKLKATADNYIAIKTDDTDPVVLHIAPSNSKYKVEYHARDQKINVTNGTANAGYEYRTLYTGWEDTSLTGFGRDYQYQGATIYIREVSDLHSPLAAKANIKDITIKDKPVVMATFDIGSLPGKEMKFNIAKEANGPSVAADYAKGVVKIKKGLEWRFVTATAAGATTAAVDADAKGKDVNDIVGSASEGTLEVRKQATGEGKKGKVASKWTRVKVQKLQDVTDKVKGDVATVTTGGATKDVDVFTSTGASVSATFDYDSKKDKVKSLIIKNNLSSDIEYVVKTDKPTAADKVKKIAKSGKTSKISTSLSGNLWIRIAGDKKNKVWVTDFANVGTLTFPK